MAPFNSTGNDADFRSLRLAAPVLTAEVLEQFVQYQRAFMENLGSQPSAEVQSRAHLAALAHSGIAPKALSRVSALCADFCAKRGVVKRLAARRAELSALPPEARVVEAIARIDSERPRLEDLGPLERRYGKDEIERLLAREDELLSLHRLILAADPPIRPAR